jgi:hypothetical protein
MNHLANEKRAQVIAAIVEGGRCKGYGEGTGSTATY